MVRLRLAIGLDYEIAAPGCDFIFNIHVAYTDRQRVLAESLRLDPDQAWRLETDPATQNRYLRLSAGPGPFSLTYEATVDLSHHVGDPATIGETPVAQLPAAVLGYVYPSRYCQSDRLLALAMRHFGHLAPGYARVQAVCDWVQSHTTFLQATTNANTSAVDTLIETVGVCRDFAHLMIALCRALNIPARFATGADYGADPALGPTDFHAYVEVYLDGR